MVAKLAGELPARAQITTMLDTVVKCALHRLYSRSIFKVCGGLLRKQVCVSLRVDIINILNVN